MRILVTSAGSTAAQNLIKALAAATDVFVVAGDMRARHGGIGLAHKDVVVPAGSAPDYVGALSALVDEFDLDLVVPVFTPELLAAAAVRHQYSWLLVSPLAAVETCVNKRKLAAHLGTIAVPQPRALPPTKAVVPAFVRPESGTGSARARAVYDQMLLDRVLQLEDDLLVTELIDGPELSVDGFAYPDGTLVHAICRTRDEVKGGLAVQSTVVSLQPFVAMVTKVSNSLGLSGFFNLQFRLDSQGSPRVFDVNPRLGGAMSLSFAAGLDAVGYLRAICTGGAMPAERREQLGLTLFRRWHDRFDPAQS